ncbi:MAG: peptide MFS transporter [Chlorobi bacterium]|nr:peptide MFS transporter [Chlorobiota bacterium]
MMSSKKFPKTFWVANTLELFERWAWYGLFMVLAVYLTGSTDTGALGFTQSQKGYLMGSVVGILYFLPVITGALADKFGYKKTLLAAFAILSSGYYMMGLFRNYYSVFFAFLYLAVGAALFKPVVIATISKTTTKKTSSIGFGIYYMIVNVGAFIGPIFASKLRETSWSYVFYMSSAIIALNFVLVLLFYKEPEREINKEPLGKSIVTIFKNIGIALKDTKFVILLLIIVGFWTMYNQLFYLLPVFVDQWVDTTILYRIIANISPWFASKVGTAEGTILPEMLLNIDALYIVIFQVLISSLITKWKPLSTMSVGFLISSIGLGLSVMTQNPLFLLLSIFIFAIGEMSSSPRIQEYIGMIAPKGKTALYMGCSYLPFALGSFLAGIISGNVYGAMSDKTVLLKKEILQRGLNIPEVSNTFSQNDYYTKAYELLHMNQKTLTEFLWNKYHPEHIMYLLTGIGITTAIILFLYDRIIIKKIA